MMITLDDNVPLSKAKLWQCQQQFYQHEGIAAWQNQVPFYASSNAFIASGYADMLVAFMLDWQEHNGAGPFKIIELGAGCGQFGFLCLQALSSHPQAHRVDWHYILSDFDDGIIDFWKAHPGFKPYVEAGHLSFLKYSVDKPLQLETTKAPLIVIANYLFDSLPADVYHVSAEEVNPVYITTRTQSDNYQDGLITNFDGVQLSFERQPALTEVVDPILEQYRLTLLNTTMLYPAAALQMLASLQELSPAGVLLLASDKAYVDAAELDQLDPPELTSHNGCFSLMVNFNAIERFAYLNSGDAILPSSCSGIKTGLFSFGFKVEDFERTHNAAGQHIQCFSTADYLNFFRQIEKNKDTYTLEDCTSLLALSCWDAEVYQRLYRRITEKLDQADMLTVDNLIDHMPQVAARFYWMPKRDDVFFQIAVMLHTLKRYEAALGYYQQSLNYYPDIFGLYFNMGVCHYNLNQLDQAKCCFKAALQLDPIDKSTQQWLTKLELDTFY